MDDLANLAEGLVVGYLRTPDGRAAAEKCIVKVLNDAIASATGYSSDFRKQVDAAMLKALQLNEGVEIASYNDAILKVIERQVEHATADAIERQVAARMKDLLRPVPAEIKLSELVEEYRKHLKGKRSAGCDCHGDARMTFAHETPSGAFHYYSLDPEPGQPPNRCEVRFGVYQGKVFFLSFESAEVEKRLFVGPLYGFHRFLFQLKAANATLVLDCGPDDVDLSYGDDY